MTNEQQTSGPGATVTFPADVPAVSVDGEGSLGDPFVMDMDDVRQSAAANLVNALGMVGVYAETRVEGGRTVLSFNDANAEFLTEIVRHAARSASSGTALGQRIAWAVAGKPGPVAD